MGSATTLGLGPKCPVPAALVFAHPQPESTWPLRDHLTGVYPGRRPLSFVGKVLVVQKADPETHHLEWHHQPHVGVMLARPTPPFLRVRAQFKSRVPFLGKRKIPKIWGPLNSTQTHIVLVATARSCQTVAPPKRRKRLTDVWDFWAENLLDAHFADALEGNHFLARSLCKSHMRPP